VLQKNWQCGLCSEFPFTKLQTVHFRAYGLFACPIQIAYLQPLMLWIATVRTLPLFESSQEFLAIPGQEQS
jgi:hypothetical protein